MSNNFSYQNKHDERLFINKFRLDALLENIPEIIYMQDLDGNYITGTKYSYSFIFEGYDVIHNLYLKQNQINTNLIEQPLRDDIREWILIEVQLDDKNGIPHFYNIYKAPVNDLNNVLIGTIVMIKNLDEEKVLSAQRETFVASLGHDLKNPTLAQIRAVELLLKNNFGTLNNEQREILEMVLDSCKYMKAMLSSLLETYKHEKGAIKLNCEEFNFTLLTEECIGEMTYLAKDKNIEIVFNNSQNIFLVEADKVLLRRVIMNLLSNAVKYAFKNTKINIEISQTENCLNFCVENNSPYIPTEKQDTIFARYISYAEIHKELGVGLGLYASKKIITAHSGEIFVKSFIENRNIFGFTIPNICSKSTEGTVVVF